ncbi:MAG: polysaccharide biosynthesis/export family protein [Planctomycetia bacterium]|nr:polysaccharide biosynthesis/export family protein [Planctomycetia bacterium]
MCSAPMPAATFGVHCDTCNNCGEQGWRAMGPIPWGVLAQGEYIGPARTAHVPVYRCRVDDQLDFVYRLTRNEQHQAYRLDIGDQIRVESTSTPTLNQPEAIAPPDIIGLLIQPDGTVSLRLLGAVKVAGKTVTQVRMDLEERYKKFVREPGINIVPYTFNLKLKDIRDSVDRRYGAGGQSQPTRVTPEGTVQLPALGSIPVQGLTLEELKREVDQRYSLQFGEGLEVTPILTARAPRYVYVVGEVRNPGRFTLEAPTSVMQSISLAGGWNVGANLNQVVVFRRDDNWRLMATKLDIRGALYGKTPCPADEIWLRDSDIVVVPKSPVLVVDDIISLLFTRGLYGVAPFNMTLNFAKLSSI